MASRFHRDVAMSQTLPSINTDAAPTADGVGVDNAVFGSVGVPALGLGAGIHPYGQSKPQSSATAGRGGAGADRNHPLALIPAGCGQG